MKDVEMNYTFDLELVLKKANSLGLTKRSEELKTMAFYILDDLGSRISIDFETLKNARIKTSETYNLKEKKDNEPTVKKRRVIKYFVMSKRGKLDILKQITVTIKRSGYDKEVYREMKIFEEQDLIDKNYLNDEGYINYNHPLIKKLVPKKTKGNIEH